MALQMDRYRAQQACSAHKGSLVLLVSWPVLSTLMRICRACKRTATANQNQVLGVLGVSLQNTLVDKRIMLSSALAFRRPSYVRYSSPVYLVVATTCTSLGSFKCILGPTGTDWVPYFALERFYSAIACTHGPSWGPHAFSGTLTMRTSLNLYVVSLVLLS